MNAFESLIRTLLEREGFWVRSSFKVNLTKEEKRAINRPSCPRWEIDLVAYKAKSNELRLVECKSYLDSGGVWYEAFTSGQEGGHFKLFTDSNLRGVVTKRLVTQLVDSGTCLRNPTVTMCLAAGKVRSKADRESLRDHFRSKGWQFWDDEWIRGLLSHTSQGSYEDDVASIVAKLLLRDGAGR